MAAALLTVGTLALNTDLGHVYLEYGIKAVLFTSGAVRKIDDLSWKAWCNRFNKISRMMEKLL